MCKKPTADEIIEHCSKHDLSITQSKRILTKMYEFCVEEALTTMPDFDDIDNVSYNIELKVDEMMKDIIKHNTLMPSIGAIDDVFEIRLNLTSTQSKFMKHIFRDIRDVATIINKHFNSSTRFKDVMFATNMSSEEAHLAVRYAPPNNDN